VKLELDMKAAFTLCLAAVLFAAQLGCNSRETSLGAGKAAPALLELPLELIVRQRSSTAVPGTSGALRLTVDDVTGGQVIVSLADIDGKEVLAPISLTPSDSALFKMNEVQYQIELQELNNALIGEDFAAFVISATASNRISEQEKIEQLLAMIESEDGLVFIRNGAEHSASEAVDHLRSKWRAAGDHVTTAQQFVDQIGSASSLSSQPYRVRLPNGAETLASAWLQDKLDQLESQ
jgi:hypothetical protein